MIQGTMSGAGKSLLCAALCRIFRQDGWRVAPFKSQNMALNSYVTADGLEMGRAQVVQAEAAGIAPDVRMNPVLLKPSSDAGSQVVVMGKARGHMRAAEYFRYKKSLIPEILAAYESLAAEHDLIVIEGAGSPAEINLRQHDIVNMGLAELLDAPVLLVGDIDRGGVFAQLYGTVELLAPSERRRVRGLIINKFRGDAEILRPGLAQLETLTGIPVFGVVPYLNVNIDDEDSLSPLLSQTAAHKPVDIAVIRFPRISNFTDFAPLECHPLLGVRYVDSVRRLGTPDIVILPGTKSVISDLLWTRQNGLEAALLQLVARNTPILGVCGGYQMLGERIDDASGVESDVASVRGMGLLPCRTAFAPSKTLTRVGGVVAHGELAGARLDGYEIHMGRTESDGAAFCLLDDNRRDGCCQGNVMGTYLHGLFDSGELTEKLCAWLCARKGIEADNAAPESHAEYKERQYDLLAEGVRSALDMKSVRRVLEETV
jgi:adenosylcobyric acid synthase